MSPASSGTMLRRLVCQRRSAAFTPLSIPWAKLWPTEAPTSRPCGSSWATVSSPQPSVTLKSPNPPPTLPSKPFCSPPECHTTPKTRCGIQSVPHPKSCNPGVECHSSLLCNIRRARSVLPASPATAPDALAMPWHRDHAATDPPGASKGEAASLIAAILDLHQRLHRTVRRAIAPADRTHPLRLRRRCQPGFVFAHRVRGRYRLEPVSLLEIRPVGQKKCRVLGKQAMVPFPQQSVF